MQKEQARSHAETGNVSLSKKLYKKALIPYRTMRVLYDRAHFLPRLASGIATTYENPQRVLDIGAGRGYFGDALQDVLPKSAMVVSTDISAKDHNRKTPFVASSADQLPFADKVFDVSTLFYVLHHMDNPLAALEEAKRVSDRIVVHEDTYKNRWQRWLISDHVEGYQAGNPRIGATINTDAEWQQLFDEAGLQVAKKRRIRRLGYPVPRYEYHLEPKAVFEAENL